MPHITGRAPESDQHFTNLVVDDTFVVRKRLVAANLSVGDLTVSGISDLRGDVIIGQPDPPSGQPTGDLIVNGDLVVLGTTLLDNNTEINGDLTVNGDITANNISQTGLPPDFYEEGNFFPIVEGTTVAGDGAYTVQCGQFTRIGRTVTLQFHLEWVALLNGTGNFRISNLPYSASSTAQDQASVTIAIFQGNNYELSAGGTDIVSPNTIQGVIDGGTSQIDFSFSNKTDLTTTTIAPVALPRIGKIVVSATYVAEGFSFNLNPPGPPGVPVSPPNTTILTGPLGIVSSTSATFTWTSTGIVTSYEISLDGAPFVDVGLSTTITYPLLAGGGHNFQVAARNVAGVDPTPASRSWIIDGDNPDTVIVTPGGTLFQIASVTLDVTANDATSAIDRFEYVILTGGSPAPPNILGAPWVDITTLVPPGTFTPNPPSSAVGQFTLNDTNSIISAAAGLQTFDIYVRAVDVVGNFDQSPAMNTYNFNTGLPGVILTPTGFPPTVADEVVHVFEMQYVPPVAGGGVASFFQFRYQLDGDVAWRNFPDATDTRVRLTELDAPLTDPMTARIVFGPTPLVYPATLGEPPLLNGVHSFRVQTQTTGFQVTDPNSIVNYMWTVQCAAAFPDILFWAPISTKVNWDGGASPATEKPIPNLDQTAAGVVPFLGIDNSVLGSPTLSQIQDRSMCDRNFWSGVPGGNGGITPAHTIVPDATNPPIVDETIGLPADSSFFSARMIGNDMNASGPLVPVPWTNMNTNGTTAGVQTQGYTCCMLYKEMSSVGRTDDFALRITGSGFNGGTIRLDSFLGLYSNDARHFFSLTASMAVSTGILNLARQGEWVLATWRGGTGDNYLPPGPDVPVPLENFTHIDMWQNGIRCGGIHSSNFSIPGNMPLNTNISTFQIRPNRDVAMFTVFNRALSTPEIQTLHSVVFNQMNAVGAPLAPFPNFAQPGTFLPYVQDKFEELGVTPIQNHTIAPINQSGTSNWTQHTSFPAGAGGPSNLNVQPSPNTVILSSITAPDTAVASAATVELLDGGGTPILPIRTVGVLDYINFQPGPNRLCGIIMGRTRPGAPIPGYILAQNHVLGAGTGMSTCRLYDINEAAPEGVATLLPLTGNPGGGGSSFARAGQGFTAMLDTNAGPLYENTVPIRRTSAIVTPLRVTTTNADHGGPGWGVALSDLAPAGAVGEFRLYYNDS
jgi:hypothetical protein